MRLSGADQWYLRHRPPINGCQNAQWDLGLWGGGVLRFSNHSNQFLDRTVYRREERDGRGGCL